MPDVQQIFEKAKAENKSKITALDAAHEEEPGLPAHLKRADFTAMSRYMLQASEQGHKWTARDSEDFDKILARIDHLDAEAKIQQADLDRQAQAHFGGARSQVGGWHDSSGRPIAVLAPGDRLASLPSTGSRSDIGLHDIMRGMAGGEMSHDVRATLSEGSDSQGGVTVPHEVMRRMIDAMRAKSVAIQSGARTVALETSRTSIARIQSDPKPKWRPESGSVHVDDPTFSSAEFNAKSLAVLCKVPMELLMDSVNLEDAMVKTLAGAMASEWDRAAIFGSGQDNEPTGLYNLPDIPHTTIAENGALPTGYGELLDLRETLETANANEPTAMIVHPRTARIYAGLTASDGQPLQRPQALQNIPMRATTSAPTDIETGTSTDTSPVVAGDFSDLLIGVRQQFRLKILDGLFAENLQVGFLAYLRMDTAVEHPGSFAILDGIKPRS